VAASRPSSIARTARASPRDSGPQPLGRRQADQLVDHFVQRPGGVHIDRSGRTFVGPIEFEHELDATLAEGPVVLGTRLEAIAHRVIVDAEVEDPGEVGQEQVAIAAAATDEQHVWSGFSRSLRAVCRSHMKVSCATGPPGRPVSGSAWKAQARSVEMAGYPRLTSSS
jgi:hypothetical protein